MGRGKAAKTIQLRDRARDILHEIQPATVRAVCYRLFSEGLIPDMSISSTKRISSILTEAREEGVIPWEHLVDNTRVPHRARVFETPRTFSNAMSRMQHVEGELCGSPRKNEISANLEILANLDRRRG